MCFAKLKKYGAALFLVMLALLSAKNTIVNAETDEVKAELVGTDTYVSAAEDLIPGITVLDEAETYYISGENLMLGSHNMIDEDITTFGLLQSGVTVMYQERVDTFIRPDSDKIGNGTATEINPACAIKYIVDDWEHGESLDASGNSRCRYVYCTKYQKDSPAGQILTKSGYLNRFVHYVMYHGAMYYGETCRHAPYSTGNWRYDYLVTQMAIHVVNGEFTLDNLIRGINMSHASDADKALVIDRISSMVQDAWSVGEAAHAGWDQDGWFRTDDTKYTTFTLSEVLDNWTFGGDGYYYTDWIKPILTTKGGYYANYDISYIIHEVTDGVIINKMYADSSFSPYRLAIPWETYEAWRTTGKTVTSIVTVKIPSHWKATEFTASGGNNFQNVCFITSTAQEATYRASISIQIPQATGNISVKKYSSDNNMTNDNDNYSLSGAKFALYKVESDGSVTKYGETYTTDANGMFSINNIPIGTYRLKEVAAPKGYLLETTYSKDIVVTVDQTTDVILTNTPKSLPISVLLQKKDAETGQSMPQGKGSMAGAEFTVRYYTKIMDSDPALSGYKPVRTWVIKTDDTGCSGLNEKYFVRGDVFYKNESDQVVCPYGTLTIQETKPPKGYLLNPELFITKIMDSSSGNIKLSSKPVIKEYVNKVKIIKKRDGTDICLSGVTFELEYPDGTKEKVTTDKNGEAIFKGLPEGQYTVREIETKEHYQLSKDTITFCVNSEHQIVDGQVKKSADGSEGKVSIDYDKNQNIVITFGNKTKEYRLVIHKTDDRSVLLSGAEFTLYEDKEQKKVVKKGITSKGLLSLEGLQIGKTYYLVETRAPEGYSLKKDEKGNAHVYEIYAELDGQHNFIFYVNGDAYQENAVDERNWIYFTKTEHVTNVNMTVINQSNSKLPETGSVWMIPLILTGVTFLSVSIVLKKRKGE